jgi:hypothetical protein
VDYKPFASAIVVPAQTWLKGRIIFEEHMRMKSERGHKDTDAGWCISANKKAGGGLGGGWLPQPTLPEVVDKTWFFLVASKDSYPGIFRVAGQVNFGTLEVVNTNAQQLVSMWQGCNWTTTAQVYAHFNYYFIVSAVPANEHVGFAGAFFGGLWCPCDVCTREKVCEHVIAVRMMLREVSLPAQYAAFKGKKRPRGRPVTGTWAGGRNGRGGGSGFSDSDEVPGAPDSDEEPGAP